MHTINVISLGNLIGMLLTAKGARFATIVAVTDARLLKTGNPFGQVFKRSRVNVVINHKYENSVNNQRVREGGEADFVASPRKWGERINGTPFVQHKGKLYLECGVQRSLGHEYFNADGILTSEQIAEFQQNKASNAEHQGVDKEIILRDYGTDTIESITIDGSHYEIDYSTLAASLKEFATA